MNFAGRPYAHLGIAELERLVQEGPDRRETNAAILAELKHRTVPRAQTFRRLLETMLARTGAVPDAAKSDPERP